MDCSDSNAWVGVGQLVTALMVVVIAYLQLRNQKFIADRQNQFEAISAERQLAIDNEKLRFDLFEKRFDVYKALERLMYVATDTSSAERVEVVREAWEEFWRAQRQAQFLFDDDVNSYLAMVKERLIELLSVAPIRNTRDRHGIPYSESDARNDERISEIEKWLAAQNQSLEVSKLFGRYLSFRNLNRFDISSSFER